MTRVRIDLVVCILLATPLLAVAQRCDRVLTVEEVIRDSRKLDGRTTCVKGVLRPILDSRNRAFAFLELIPLGSVTGRTQPKDIIGMMEWSAETEIDGAEYRPDSFKLLEPLTGEKIGDKRLVPTFEVVVRGAIMHEKGFFKRLSARLPSSSLYDPLRGLSYSVEFVLLEVVTVKLAKAQ